VLIAKNKMKKHFHKMATYSALTLISSIPFPVDVFADAEKTQAPAFTVQ
jgi:hypothetical protein